VLHGTLKVAVKGARLCAEERERGRVTAANEIALDGISRFEVPLKKSATGGGGGRGSIAKARLIQ
jgi:hypothetical protein